MDLVYALPAAEGGTHESRDATSLMETSEDPFCSFWKGDDPRIHADVCSVLDEAGIPHKTVRRRDHLFNLSNYAEFQIGVPFSLFERAETAVKDAFDLDASDPDAAQNLSASLLPEPSRGIRRLPERLTPPMSENVPGPPSEGEAYDWHPGDATTEIWSGDDSWLGNMIAASLRENQMYCRRDAAEGRYTVFVLPAEEDRAREIVREIVEGTPPE